MQIVNWSERRLDLATGVAVDRVESAIVQRAIVDADEAGANELIAAVEGKRIGVLKALLMAADDVVATLISVPAEGDPTAISGPLPLAGGGGFLDAGSSPAAALFVTLPGEGLSLSLSAAVAVGGAISYILIDADPPV